MRPSARGDVRLSVTPDAHPLSREIFVGARSGALRSRDMMRDTISGAEVFGIHGDARRPID